MLDMATTHLSNYKLENRQLKYLGGLPKNHKVIVNETDNIEQRIRLDELA